MQIDRFSHLQFPRHSMPNASENESSGVPPRAGLSKPPAQLPVPVADGILVRPDSVVMKVQLPENASARASVAVYSDSRKPVSAGDTKADAETQAADTSVRLIAMRVFTRRLRSTRTVCWLLNPRWPELRSSLTLSHWLCRPCVNSATRPSAKRHSRSAPPHLRLSGRGADSKACNTLPPNSRYSPDYCLTASTWTTKRTFLENPQSTP